MVSLILLVLDNLKGTLLFIVCVVLVAFLLIGLWSIVTFVGLDESHPVIAEAIVYVALMLVMALLVIAGLMTREKP